MASPSTPTVGTPSAITKASRSRRSATPGGRKRERGTQSPAPKTPKPHVGRSKSTSVVPVERPPTPAQARPAPVFSAAEFAILPRVLSVVEALQKESEDGIAGEPSHLVKAVNELGSHIATIRTKIANIPGNHLSAEQQKEALEKLKAILEKRQTQLARYVGIAGDSAPNDGTVHMETD